MRSEQSFGDGDRQSESAVICSDKTNQRSGQDGENGCVEKHDFQSFLQLDIKERLG